MDIFQLRWRLGRQGLLMFEKGNAFEVSNLGTPTRGTCHMFNSMEDVERWLEELERTGRKEN